MVIAFRYDLDIVLNKLKPQLPLAMLFLAYLILHKINMIIQCKICFLLVKNMLNYLIQQKIS